MCLECIENVSEDNRPCKYSEQARAPLAIRTVHVTTPTKEVAQVETWAHSFVSKGLKYAKREGCPKL